MKDESGDAIIARHLRNLALDLNNGMSEENDALERMRERFNAEVDEDKIPFLTHRDRHFYELEKRLKTATKNLKKIRFATDDAEGNAVALSGVRVSERAAVDCLPGMIYQHLDECDICFLSMWRDFKTAVEGFIQDKITRCLLQKNKHSADELRCAIAYIRLAATNSRIDNEAFRDCFVYALWLDREATAEMNGETIDLSEQPQKPASVSTEDLMQMMQEVKAEARGAKVAAEHAAAGFDELAAEMTAWRKWVRELATNPTAKPSEPPLCAVVQGNVCEIWQRFKNAPADCELPSGAFRKTKRTFAECLALHGKDEVWHGKRLIDFIPDEKAFERVVHNGAEKARQAKAKTMVKTVKSQKRKTQARRKK